MYEITLTEDHRYLVDGVEKPGVTSILTEAGYIDPTYFNEDGALRGTHVHIITEFLDEGDLNWDSVDERYMGYVRGYELFKKDTGFDPIEIELKGYSERYNYCGMLDRIGLLNGCLALVDLKTGARAAWWALQLAAYEELAKEQYPGLVRYSLQLKENGTYSLSEPYTDPNDMAVFVACLVLYRDKQGRGLIK